MTLADPKPGGWASHEVLTSTQMNNIRTELLKAIDGVGGGSYSLSAPLTLDGDELRIDQLLRIRTGADLVVDSGGDAILASGSTLDVNGTWSLDGNGTVTGDVSVPVASVWTFESITALQIDSEDVLYRLDPTGVYVVESGGDPTWTSIGSSPWTQQILSSNAIINYPLRINEGDTLVSVGITLDGAGGHGGVLPSTMPRIRLMESSAFGDTWSSVFSYDDPSASAAAYEAQHTFVIENSVEAALPYVALNRSYRLEIRGENGGSAVTGLELGTVAPFITRTQLVSTNII